MSKKDKPLNHREGKIWVVLLDLLERRPKLCILNDGVRKDAGASHGGLSRYLAGYPFH